MAPMALHHAAVTAPQDRRPPRNAPETGTAPLLGELSRATIGRFRWRPVVPAISMFFGVVIYLYFKDDQQHHVPHIHARYQDQEVVVAIPDGTVLQGSIPGSKLKLVVAWVEMHQEELMANWGLAASGQLPFKIDPLR